MFHLGGSASLRRLQLDNISFEIHLWWMKEGAEAMSTHTSMLHIRMDDNTKEQATKALAAMGLSVSEAVRLFMHRIVVDQAFPLELKVPNAETRAAMEDSRAILAARRARFASADALLDDLEKNSRR
jgi:DNA-damage-inducible protein J